MLQPAASQARSISTEIRVPLIVGFSRRISGSWTVRSRLSMSLPSSQSRRFGLPSLCVHRDTACLPFRGAVSFVDPPDCQGVTPAGDAMSGERPQSSASPPNAVITLPQRSPSSRSIWPICAGVLP